MLMILLHPQRAVGLLQPFRPHLRRLVTTLAFTPESILAQPIASDANERVKTMKSLQAKKNREALGLVLLEGHRQVIDALAAGHVPAQVLLTERAARHAPLCGRLMEALTSASTSAQPGPSVHSVTEAVMDRLADTVQSQGVLASFPRPAQPLLSPARPTLRASPLILLLDRLADPGNVGTLLRTAFGLGADGVVVAGGCDAWSPKVLRASMGCGLQFPVVEAAWGAEGGDGGGVEEVLLAAIRTTAPSTRSTPPTLITTKTKTKTPSKTTAPASRWQVVLAVADPKAQPYTSVDLSRPTVMIIGSEADGISPHAETLAARLSVLLTAGEGQGHEQDQGEGEDQEHEHGQEHGHEQEQQEQQGRGQGRSEGEVQGVDCVRVHIPTVRMLESLNAAVAGTILLAEAARQRG